MLLISLLIISLTLLTQFRFSLLEFILPVAEKAHLFCLQQLPKNSFSLAELQALVCAENFNNLSSSQLYISSGLIHLFVVSGAHLILIEKILKKIPTPYKPDSSVILLALTVYGFFCALNAPVVRSLLAFSLSTYLFYKKISWPPHLKILVTGLAALCLDYHWLKSLSLQMSWIAAFLVVLSQLFFKRSSVLLKQSLFFFSLLPTLIFFQIPSAVVILCNLVLAPFLELVLFPLGLIVWFFNFLHPVFDATIYLFKAVLKSLEIEFHPQTADLPAHLVLYNWFFILFLHVLFHFVHIHQKRKLSP